nr:MAG TPA: hypothetical protein [Caudoviricetes sp.]
MELHMLDKFFDWVKIACFNFLPIDIVSNIFA